MCSSLEDGGIYSPSQQVLVVEIDKGQSLTGWKVGGTRVAIEELLLVAPERLERDELPENILRVADQFDRHKVHIGAGIGTPVEGERGKMIVIRPQLTQMAEAAKAAQGVEDGPAFRRTKLAKRRANIKELRVSMRSVEHWLSTNGAPGIGETARPDVLPGGLGDSSDSLHHLLIRWACPQRGVRVVHQPDQDIDPKDGHRQHRYAEAQVAADTILVCGPSLAARDLAAGLTVVVTDALLRRVRR